MKLFNIPENVVCKARKENIYYVRIGDKIYKNYFYDIDPSDYKFIVNSIEELRNEVITMDLTFTINYKPDTKEISVGIRQADNSVYLNDEEVKKLLEEMNEVMTAPF